VDEFVQRAFVLLNESFSAAESLEIMIIDDSLVVNKSPVRDAGGHIVNLINRMKRKGISRIDFMKGITQTELRQFITDMAAHAMLPGTYPHIRTGTVDVKAGKPRIVRAEGMTDHLDGMKEFYPDLASFRRLNPMGLEEIVVNFITAFKQEAGIIRLMSPIRVSADFMYSHAINVSVLSIFQAGALGAGDDLLQDIGMAGLLHDVGKIFVSRQEISKKDQATERDREELQRHTLYGARYLTKVDGLTRLAPIVALEHHLRYDCKGYPKLRMNGKKQHICSQIVAISDFFDIFRTRRPQNRDWNTGEILYLMRGKSGSLFNPSLMDNFSRIMLTALSGSENT
jgi:HD-GYP domain-containing protein (c-di-GMP phosphodiesterase class II)